MPDSAYNRALAMNPKSAISRDPHPDPRNEERDRGENRKSLCIVGLGLMGASLALAVRGKYARITAVTRRPETAGEALKRNIVDAASTDFNTIQDADIVVLAAPVRTIIQQLESIQKGRMPLNGCVQHETRMRRPTPYPSSPTSAARRPRS